MSGTRSGPHRVVVVGAGIIGLSCALRLQHDGHEVTLVDDHEPLSGCSSGHAGYLSEGSIFPVAGGLGALAIIGMALRRNGPLVVRWRHLPRLAPWGLELFTALRPSRLSAIVGALARLNVKAVDALTALLDAVGASDLIRRDGGLVVCRTAHALESRSAALATYERHGILAQRLTRDELGTLEPGVSSEVAGALFFPNSAHCVDLHALAHRMQCAFTLAGGTLVRERVCRIERRGRSWSTTSRDRTLQSDSVVVAAGMGSKALLEPFGYRVPLEAERGYHLMLPRPSVTLRRPLVVAEHHFAATPMNGGLRLAGTVEFAPAGAPMDTARAAMLFDQARGYLPGLTREGATPWMGGRPSLPDSLPAIGAHANKTGLVYAFGHHHSGFMQSGISADLVSALIAGERPALEVSAFDLARFSRSSRPKRRHGARSSVRGRLTHRREQ